MIPDLSFITRQHLAVAREKPAVSLIRKRCACGKACHAKQLVQYGRCVACVKSGAEQVERESGLLRATWAALEFDIARRGRCADVSVETILRVREILSLDGREA